MVLNINYSVNKILIDFHYIGYTDIFLRKVKVFILCPIVGSFSQELYIRISLERF